MNLDEAKQIPIQNIVDHLGGILVQGRGHKNELWFRSPFRDDSTPSFKVDLRTNKFIDFGDGRGMGSTVDLWLDFHNKSRTDKYAISDALKALEQFSTLPPVKRQFPEEKRLSDTYKIVSRSNIFRDKNLLLEMTRRGLPKSAFDVFEQVQVMNTNTGKKVNTFGMDNIAGGTECMTYFPKRDRPFETPDKWKRCIGPKAPTIFHAHPDCEEITCYAFSSAMDFVTYRHKKGTQKPDEECVIYHGDALVAKAAEYILSNHRIKKVKHYKHTDEAGEKADLEFASLLDGLEYGTMEHEYVGFKDLSDSITVVAPKPGHTSKPPGNSPQPRLRR